MLRRGHSLLKWRSARHTVAAIREAAAAAPSASSSQPTSTSVTSGDAAPTANSSYEEIGAYLDFKSTKAIYKECRELARGRGPKKDDQRQNGDNGGDANALSRTDGSAVFTEVVSRRKVALSLTRANLPMNGLVFGASDSIDVTGFLTRFGVESDRFDTVPSTDDPLVMWLRQSGALCVGKMRCETPFGLDDSSCAGSMGSALAKTKEANASSANKKQDGEGEKSGVSESIERPEVHPAAWAALSGACHYTLIRSVKGSAGIAAAADGAYAFKPTTGAIASFPALQKSTNGDTAASDGEDTSPSDSNANNTHDEASTDSSVSSIGRALFNEDTHHSTAVVAGSHDDLRYLWQVYVGDSSVAVDKSSDQTTTATEDEEDEDAAEEQDRGSAGAASSAASQRSALVDDDAAEEVVVGVPVQWIAATNAATQASDAPSPNTNNETTVSAAESSEEAAGTMTGDAAAESEEAASTEESRNADDDVSETPASTSSDFNPDAPQPDSLLDTLRALGVINASLSGKSKLGKKATTASGADNTTGSGGAPLIQFIATDVASESLSAEELLPIIDTIANYELAAAFRHASGTSASGSPSGLLATLPAESAVAVEKGMAITLEEYNGALNQLAPIRRAAAAAFADVDMLVVPLMSPPCKSGDLRTFSYALPFALAGNPMVSVPLRHAVPRTALAALYGTSVSSHAGVSASDRSNGGAEEGVPTALLVIGELGRDTDLLDNSGLLLKHLGISTDSPVVQDGDSGGAGGWGKRFFQWIRSSHK